MKSILVLLMLIVLAIPAQAQERASVRFSWTQPDTTTTGKAMADGWMKEYRVYLAADGDTIMVTVAPAPFALADSAWVMVSLEIGMPSAVQVEGVNKWDTVGPVRSLWSDTHIVVPDPPAAPGRPGSGQ